MVKAWTVVPAAWPRDIAAAVEAWARGELAWLDDALTGSAAAGRSVVADDPLAVLEQSPGEPARLTTRDGVVLDEDASGWQLWRRVGERLAGFPARPGLGPGWLGFVGFEMARWLERLPASNAPPADWPLMRVGLYDTAIVLDHARRGCTLVRAEGLAEGLGIARRESPVAAATRWEQACTAQAGAWRTPRPTVTATMTRRAYVQGVERALAYIAAGDIYQVNLAQRLVLDGVGDPLAHYARLRRVHPARYGALLRWDKQAVASISPELFLRLRGREVLTSPIKGTAPRRGDEQDARRRAALLASSKERAELAMIVDLHRNDLGRVCTPGSVRVARARRVEALPTLYHTVADVTGTLAPGRTAFDLLAACFPAGSISGVPKVRALGIIDELEPVGRGAYTGTILNLTLGGELVANVAIRTLQFHQSQATLYAGGGIVAESDPAAEYAETLAKARGMLAGMGAPMTPNPAAPHTAAAMPSRSSLCRNG